MLRFETNFIEIGNTGEELFQLFPKMEVIFLQLVVYSNGNKVPWAIWEYKTTQKSNKCLFYFVSFKNKMWFSTSWLTNTLYLVLLNSLFKQGMIRNEENMSFNQQLLGMFKWI